MQDQQLIPRFNTNVLLWMLMVNVWIIWTTQKVRVNYTGLQHNARNVWQLYGIGMPKVRCKKGFALGFRPNLESDIIEIPFWHQQVMNLFLNYRFFDFFCKSEIKMIIFGHERPKMTYNKLLRLLKFNLKLKYLSRILLNFLWHDLYHIN